MHVMMSDFEDFQKHYLELVNDDSILSNWQIFSRRSDNIDVRKFIIETESFRNRVQQVFNRLYPVVCEKLSNKNEKKDMLFSRCLTRFREYSNFSVQMLTDMLRDVVTQQELPEEEQQELPKEEQREERKTEEEEVRPRIGGSVRTFISEFEEIAKRPMYAHELVIVTNSDVDDARFVVNRTRSMYQLISDVVLRYEGKHISEHEFARDYLQDVFHMDEENVTDEMTDRLMRGPKYINGMMDRIRSKLKFLTGDCSEDDISHCFDHVVERKLHLLDDRIDDVLCELVAEKQNQIDKITQVYRDTYDRDPDDEELEVRIKEYRRLDQVEDCDERLRRELCEDLEYHDVLKRVIEKYLRDAKKYSSRVLFSIMKVLLSRVSPLWDNDRVHGFVQDQIREL